MHNLCTIFDGQARLGPYHRDMVGEEHGQLARGAGCQGLYDCHARLLDACQVAEVRLLRVFHSVQCAWSLLQLSCHGRRAMQV